MIRRTFRLLGIIALTALLMFGLFLAYSTLTYYNPDSKVIVGISNSPDTISTGTTLKAMTWNIGYAGLGGNMDFFYDDGKNVRDTKENTLRNLDSIVAFLDKQKERSFFLLQEVDFGSHRTYNIYQPEMLTNALNYPNTIGYNYDVAFVPIPITKPMGGVISGVITFSQQTPKLSARYQYPGEFSWPLKLFNLRRCILVNRYPTDNGHELVLINTHNSAFDDGSLKQQEMTFLKAFAMEEFLNGNYVVVGGDWNQSPPGFSLTTFASNYDVPFFKLTNIDPEFIPKGWTWAYDGNEPTNRYLNEPYTPGKNYVGILDFFLLSPNVKMIECKTHNLQFKHSDHNPVLISFELIRGNS